MQKTYKESGSNFTFEFKGENEIYAETLTQTISNLIDALQYITAKEEPEAYVKLKITSFRQGSFNIDLQAVISYVPNLLTKDNIETAGIIVGMLVGALEIKQHLKGKKPKDIIYNSNKATVINSKDEYLTKDIKTTTMFFENSQIESSIINIFNVINRDEERGDLVVKLNDEEKLEIPKENFSNMAKKVVEEKEDATETIEQIIETNLPLKKPDLLGNSQWEFIYIKSIKATMRDVEWLKKVHTGQIRNLYAGVKIPVKLLIEYDLDRYKNPIKDSDRYTILEVTGDIEEPEPDNQMKLI